MQMAAAQLVKLVKNYFLRGAAYAAKFIECF